MGTGESPRTEIGVGVFFCGARTDVIPDSMRCDLPCRSRFFTRFASCIPLPWLERELGMQGLLLALARYSLRFTGFDSYLWFDSLTCRLLV